MSLMGNIRRDYKQYRLAKGDVKGRLGCPVMIFSPQDMFAKYGKEHVKEVVDKYMIE